ncbi:Tandem-95 repeat protein [Vibrio crassostreae]|nr:Tandem-95 repeat protein [Vibrio crassostreae]
MANKKNVETNKKNTETKNKKSNELEQQKPTKKKKLRLHSHLKVNIPLFQSLMMILPSLAKHAAAETIDNPSGAADQVTANNVTEKDVTDDHSKADSSAVALQEAQTSDNDVNSTLSASHAAHGSSSHLVPSHHLSTLSHPQVHYIPSVSMPTISSGSNGQPTDSNTPTTPALPVTFMPEIIKGTYGELHVDASGQYTFVLNPNSPQYILLNQHQQGTDHFALHLSNGSSIVVQIPVAGRQDTPSISGDLTGVVTEDHNIDSQGLLHANGKIDVVDPDQSESSVTPEVISGKYGSLTIDADGHWQYQVDNSLSNVQALTAATSLHESFTIHTKDGTPQTIDMTIGGNDDNAVITGVDAGTVTEDLTTQVQGQLSVTDSDLGEDHFQASQVTSNFGTLSITKDGAWTYDLDNTNLKVQALGNRATATDTITVHSTDGTPHQITITINGTNDDATVSSATVAIDETDKAVTTSGTLTSTDVDNPDNTFTPDSIVGSNGDLTIDANGHWVFTANNAFNQLNVGDKVEETFTVSSIDGTTSTIKVMINGTNDAATVSAATVSVDETDSAITTSGTLTSTDVDNPDNTFTPDSIAGTNGDLTIDATGHWVFTANSAFNQLNVGDKVEETFTVSSVDGTSSTIKVTINGTNDVATVSTATVSVDETDKAVTTSGTLTSTDVDNPDNTFTPDSIVGANGDLTIDANGHWVFTANSAFNQLNVGDKVEETFTVSSIDGTTSTVKVTINGTNDAATVSSATVAIDETDKAVTTSGTLTSTDVDNPDNAFTPDSISGTKGDLTIDANGHWTFTANNAFNQLNVGDKVEETFTVSSIDGTTSTIKVTINGTNDAPVINAQSHSVVEGGSLLNGQMVGHDIDTGATLIYSAPQVDGLVLNPDGSYSFDPNHASYLSLASGTTKTLTIPVTLTDEHHASNTQNLSITITGANNSATISGVSTGDVDEGHGSYGDRSPDYAHPGMAKLGQDAITADGKLDIVDPDSGEAQFDPKGGAWNNSYHGQYGHLLLNSDGTWHYDVTVGGSDWVGNKKTTIGTTIDQLGEGQTLTDTITIQSKDGTTHDIVITIHGDNDRPYCSSEVQLNSGKEDTSQTLTTKELLSNTIDVDNNDAGILSIANLHSNHGSIRDNHDGTYTFTPAKDYNGQVHFTYDVKDAHGGVTATGANMNLQGVADKALIGGQHVGDITEDHLTPHLAQLTVQGHLTVVDPDGGEAHFTSVTKIDDPYNTNHDGLILSPSGAWHYGVNNYLVQHMAEGETKDIVYEVSTVDGTKQLITITLHGTNDNPELLFSGYGNLSGGPSPITTDEDKAITISVDRFMSAKDIDHGDTLHLEQLHVDHGTAVLSPDGKSVIYTPEKDFNGQVTFTYAIMDNHNAQAIDTGTGKAALSGMILTVNAVDDVAVITGTDTGSVTEDIDPYTPVSWLPNMIHTTGQLSISDPDTGEDHFDFKSFIKVASHPEWAPYQSQLGGKLSIDKNGSWEYVIDTTKPNIQVLGDRESLVDRVLIHSSDGTQHTIEVTIHGTNDAPVVTQATLLPAGVEDTRMTLTASQLLANAIDIDNNDVGLLTVANLNVDHGSVHLNPDGTYTFTPAKDYNGQVHFTYDVKDAHGGVTHTGASTTLAAVDDKTIISGIDHGVATEDVATLVYTNSHIMDAVDWQALQVTDVDSPNTQVTVEFAGKQYTWNIGSDLDVTTPYGKFQFHTIASGSHKGEHSWSYIGDNYNVHVQELKHGESLTESIKLIATDGTEFPITVKVNGTEDGIIIDSKSELGHVVENAQTGASVSGNVIAHDVDLHDTVSWTQTPTAGLNGQYGTFHLSADGQWHYDVDQSKATKLGDGDEYWEHFTVEAVSTDGSHVSKSVSVVVHGNNDAPTVSGEVSLPSGKEDTSIHITQAELIANATDVDTNDRGWLHVENLTADHGSLVSNSDGSFTFNPDPNYNGQVHFTYDVTDRHSGSVSTSASVMLTAVNDAAIISGDTYVVSTEDHIIPHNDDATYFPQRVQGQLTSNDVDRGEANQFLQSTLTGAYGHLIIHKDGSWFYEPAPSKIGFFNRLGAQDHITEIFTAHGIDGTPQQVQIQINGSNDKATITDVIVTAVGNMSHTAVTEDNSIDINHNNLETYGLVTVRDADNKGTIHSEEELKAETVTTVHGGIFTVSGHDWKYSIDKDASVVQQLGSGEQLVERHIVTSLDGTATHEVTVTITGTNDAPVLGVNQASSTTGTLTETDVDVTDSHTFSVVSSAGQFGSLSVDPNTGDYIYTPNTSITGMSYNSATNSYHGVDVFEVKVSDGHTEDSKFITFDASGHVTMSPTGGLVISTTVPQQPTVTATQPTLSSGTNVAPTNTVTLDLASTSDSGSSNTDNLTNDTTPTITGHTDIPYSQVTIYDGSTPVGHAVSDASGQYSVAVSGLSEGDHNLSAKTLAPSSVLPATSSLLSVHIDTQVHVGIQTDPITADNVVNAQESNSSIDITGSVSGDYNAGDIVTLDVNGTQHTGVVDAKGHYSIAVPGSELIADADQKIEASVAVTDTAGNSAHATADVTYQVDTQVSVPTITFENAGADNLYSKAEIARGQANTITATVTPPGDAKIGEHLVVNGQDHVLDAHTLQHGIQIEVHPGSNVQATMTDEHGNTAGSQGFAASAIPEPIIVRPPSGSHQVSGTLGVPPLLPSLTPVPTAQSGWRIHLPNGQYVTSHQGQYGTLTIDPQTGQLHYQEQAQVHTGPHGSTSGIGQHEDKFEVALQGTNQDEVVAHVNIQILSHGPGGSGKLTIGTEVVDMTITPVVHTSHPAPPPPTPVQHDEPDMTSQSDVMVTQSDDIYLDLTQQTHQEPDQKTSHHGAAAYLDALGINPDATSTTVHDQPADMDIVLAQVDQQHTVDYDQAHLDMSDALEHHDTTNNHNQDDEHHHHNDVDGLPDIDPNN